LSWDEVTKKLKQNIKTVHILTLMVAFQDRTIHDFATKVGDYNKTGGVPRPQPQAVTEHMMQLGEQMCITGNL